MALDEALLRLSPGPVLRRYRWEAPAVSFGYFSRSGPVAAAWPGRELVRRMTGGGLVPHGDDITYSIIAPATHPLAGLSARESYHAIHTTIAEWLAGQGVAAQLAAPVSGPGTGACFESPVEADVMAAGQKIAGAAQRRTREGLLVQGSIQGVPLEWGGGLPAAFGAGESRAFTEEELALATQLAAEKYGTPAWTTRL